MQNLPRPLSILLFVFRAVFTSKQGWFGVLLILFKVLWQALTVWQTLDFLPGRLMPLADFLAGIGGTLLLVGLGLLFMYRAVSARWSDLQTDTPPADASSIKTTQEWWGERIKEWGL